MYMSNSTLEKLLDILHNKMIDATDQNTALNLVNAKRARNTSSSSEEDEEEDEEEAEEKKGKGKERQREDDGNADNGGGSTAYREKVPEWLSMIESGIKLSGPVTDL